jgi:glucose/arabinose dehydrogenase
VGARPHTRLLFRTMMPGFHWYDLTSMKRLLILTLSLAISLLLSTDGSAGAQARLHPDGSLFLPLVRNNSPIVLPDINIHIDQVIADGFSSPVQVTHTGDGSGRLFVVEQPGQIKVIRNGQQLTTPFLDIHERVVFGGERGLLGLAFHPAYASNGYFYVNYTRNPDGATVISRFTVSGSNPDEADPGSEQPLLVIPQPFTNHNGGQVVFGPDGYLYIGTGDGGGSGDPQSNAQNLDNLLGKLLRIDVDSGDGYAIPADNPFVGQPGEDEIWAYGLRNPWRFSFDRLQGDLYIGDVGQNRMEEISYQAGGSAGGLNFGWRCREGSLTFSTDPPCDDPLHLATLVDPIAEHGRTEGRSITGGFVYRGLEFSGLVGRYFYGDFVTGRIWSLYARDQGLWSAPELELDTEINISSFGEDEAGELYLTDYGGGTVRKINQVLLP